MDDAREHISGRRWALALPPIAAYSDQGTRLPGVLHWNEERRGKRPGILLIHGGAGLDEHAREQARRYARLGYAVFACDMFGDGVAGDRERVIACITALRDDPALLARRGQAGLSALARCPQAGAPFAAIGYCFGGMAVLALARSGTELAAAVSIHGSLATSAPAQPGAVKARVLDCHGSMDPHVPMDHVAAFADEMDRAGARWQLIMYGGAQHGFTHKQAVPSVTPGVAYDPDADQGSFTATRQLLAEVLAGSADLG